MFFKKMFVVLSGLMPPILLLSSSGAMAHGGDISASEGRKPIEKPFIPPRRVALQPRVLTNSETKKIMEQSESPQDVLFIRCMLSIYSICRGLDIALYDTDGHLIVKGNSGLEGTVAFEGLKHEEKYEVRIQSRKYTGSAMVSGGAAWTLQGKLLED